MPPHVHGASLVVPKPRKRVPDDPIHPGAGGGWTDPPMALLHVGPAYGRLFAQGSLVNRYAGYVVYRKNR